MVMTSGTALPVGPPWGFVWLLTGGLVWLQTGRGRDPGVREGQLLWWLAETGEGGAERGFVRPREVVLGRDAASPQL